eukprot:5174247-Amphidinium_carterae.1
MPPSGSAPSKRFFKIKNSVTSLSPLLGSIPVKLFSWIQKFVTARIARMPPSGSAPTKRFWSMKNAVTSLSLLSGSIP